MSVRRVCTWCDYYFNSGQECSTCQEYGICQHCIDLGQSLTGRWHRCIQLPPRLDDSDDEDETENEMPVQK